eukprot:gnl/Chilomastix_cuspidata/1843.p2 GENE.gnl/Chilomastix_cuspidata/1843~~gnl/Chilomastix_cuspidata/1843.p2  ORF type:complete len:481 (+),score=292.91 gnl/Chilomastix_cuspidata/1843:2669-4111(+)
MPPKKKVKGKKKKAAAATRPATSMDASNEAELTRQLEEATKELDLQRKDRNYFQLERDRVYSLYEVSRARLEESEAALRNKDREMEELVEKHQVAIKVYQQKIKDLLYSSKQEATQLKTDNEHALRTEEEENRARERSLREEKRVLQLRLKELSLSHMDAVRSLKEEHLRASSLEREQFEDRLRAAQRRFDARAAQIREDADIRRKAELHEVEERKNEHIARLLAQHKASFEEIKAYYNDITESNLDLIKSLKEELAEVRKREAANEKLMFEIAQENKRLSAPLKKAVEELAELRHKLETHERQKQSLDVAQQRVEDLEKRLKVMAWQDGVKQQRFEELEKERNSLYERFEAAVCDIEERSVFREVLLERKLRAVAERAEQQEAQISEIVEAANLDPESVGAMHARLEAILDNKNRRIRELNFELMRIMRLYNEALRVFGSKLEAFGVPQAELAQFKPFDLEEGGGTAIDAAPLPVNPPS